MLWGAVTGILTLTYQPGDSEELMLPRVISSPGEVGVCHLRKKVLPTGL